MSGEMCTSLGNGFTNLMLALFIASLRHGHLEGYVEGDDGLFATDFELTKEDYLNLGFTMKNVDEVFHPGWASFCGMLFGDSLQIVRSPRRFLENFGWTHSAVHGGEKVMLGLLRAKALSAVYETPHCPIVSVLARRALHHTRGVTPRFVNDGFHNTELVPRDESKLPKFAPTTDTFDG